MNTNNNIVSTTYVPLQPPYQVIKYQNDVALQIGTLIVTIQKDGSANGPGYVIDTYSHPVVAYENKNKSEYANSQLTNHYFLEGAVWNNVEVRDVSTLCLSGARLSWEDFLAILEHEAMLESYRGMPDFNLYWQLKKLGIEILPPKARKASIQLCRVVQPEETGYSVQSHYGALLFLNASIKEEDKKGELHDVDEGKIVSNLMFQIMGYRLILQDLLFDSPEKALWITYKTKVKAFAPYVDSLNEGDDWRNLLKR